MSDLAKRKLDEATAGAIYAEASRRYPVRPHVSGLDAERDPHEAFFRGAEWALQELQRGN